MEMETLSFEGHRWGEQLQVSQAEGMVVETRKPLPLWLCAWTSLTQECNVLP